MEVAVNRRRAFGILAFAASLASGGWSRLALAGAERSCDFDDDRDCADDRDCKRPLRASTGRAEAGRDCSGKSYARSDSDLRPRYLFRRKDHDHPIERVQARGEGKIKATGDKGAIREMRNKRRWVK
jgi:hypothetical protein